MDVKEAIDIEDMIEDKYNDWLYSTNEGIGLTIEETKHILRNDPDFHYCDSLLYEAYNVVLSELEKKDQEIIKRDKIIDEMATYIGIIDVSEDLCNDEICYEGDNCNKCIKEYFTKKCEEK